MDPPVEILVHISAPSRVQDDATYRDQVEAYFGFEVEKAYGVLVGETCLNDVAPEKPASRYRSEDGQNDGRNIELSNNNGDRDLRDAGSGASELDIPRETQSITTEKILETPYPRKLSALERFKGVTAMQIERTPSNPLFETSDRDGCFGRATLKPPELEIRNNTDLANTDKILETPNSRLSSVLQRLRGATSVQIERTPDDQRPKTAPIVLSKPLEHTPIRRAHSGSWKTPPNVVPDSQPSYETLKRSFADSFSDSFPDSISWMENSSSNQRSPSPLQKRPRQDSPLPEVVLSSVPSTYQSQSLASTQPLSPLEEITRSVAKSITPTHASTLQPLANSAVPGLPEETASSASQSIVSPSTPTSQPLVSTIAAALPTVLPADFLPLYVPQRSLFTIPPPPLPSPPQYISPPPPQPSNTPFVTHLTPYLLIAPNNLPLAEYYVPLSTVRPIHPLNRGYWHIPITSFALDIKASFWDFMKQFVEEGRAGWDAALVLEEGGSGSWGELLEGEEGQGLVVKVFCWGEVVGHLWLILWVASQRRIKGVGATWRSVTEEVIVTME